MTFRFWVVICPNFLIVVIKDDHLSPLRKQMIKGKLNAMLKGKAHCTYKVKTVK